jgi:hypothetical protein
MVFAVFIGFVVAFLALAKFGGHDVPVVDGLVKDFNSKFGVDVAYNSK